MASKTITHQLLSLLAISASSMAVACAGGEVMSETFTTAEETMTTGPGDGDGDGDPGDGDGDGDGGPGDGDGGPGDGDGEPACTSAGCACDGSEDSCDPGLVCIDGSCQAQSCVINGVVDPGEQCDDNNDLEGDGCDSDCSWTMIDAVAAGANHTCAVIEGNRLRCWGLNNVGQLGYGNLDNIGDNEAPSMPGDVVLGAGVVSIEAGANHTCAVLDDATVRCWGYGMSGQLGQGNLDNIGDDEFPFMTNPISLNDDVLDIQAGGSHTCVLVASAGVRCWGENSSGQLGYGNMNNLAIPLTIDLPLNGSVTHLAVGRNHNCARFDDNKVRCWGYNNRGQLGYGNTDNIGDNETPGSVVPVPILPQGLAPDTAIIGMALGNEHSCVLFEGGDVLCWGDNFYGQLGQGTVTTVGDNETLATLFPIELGGTATALTLGKYHTCALLEGDEVKCWGRNLYGQLGYGNIDHVGDDEKPDAVGVIDVGGSVTSLSAGNHHTCAVVDGHEVVCWGFNDYGQLGYGDTLERGDDETPAASGGIDLL